MKGSEKDRGANKGLAEDGGGLNLGIIYAKLEMFRGRVNVKGGEREEENEWERRKVNCMKLAVGKI